jgi:hypothetical protein
MHGHDALKPASKASGFVVEFGFCLPENDKLDAA